MSGGNWHLIIFFLLLSTIVIMEFGGAIWCLTSRGDFHDEMVSTMEKSFSIYSSDDSVVKKWDKLQKELKCCGTDGPQDYRPLNNVPWSCCSSKSEQHGSCEELMQRGCLTSLNEFIRERLLLIALFAIGAAIVQFPGLIFCEFLLDYQRRPVDLAIKRMSFMVHTIY
ncbi:hypothetical protein L9F63_006773 [Diploptera punctata]|uniref:Uncharacterized protein n=1 Tax=Diploptera punctata TaxID=6984 RepID=A0AAD7Z9R3_DIPPU|nr:hypothetical protein L9F63_006773 [Diploptera punctata]